MSRKKNWTAEEDSAIRNQLVSGDRSAAEVAKSLGCTWTQVSSRAKVLCSAERYKKLPEFMVVEARPLDSLIVRSHGGDVVEQSRRAMFLRDNLSSKCVVYVRMPEAELRDVLATARAEPVKLVEKKIVSRKRV